MIDFLVEYAPTFLSILVGALVTFIAARFYYQKASKDLFNEAMELRRLNGLILRAMEEAGLCELNTDEDGNVRGLKISLSGHIQASSSMRVKPSVKRSSVDKI
jgi:hypothetical protein